MRPSLVSLWRQGVQIPEKYPRSSRFLQVRIMSDWLTDSLEKTPMIGWSWFVIIPLDSLIDSSPRRRNKEAEKCIREYASSCTKAFTRQYINIMLAGPLTVVKERCTRVGIRGRFSHVNNIVPELSLAFSSTVMTSVLIAELLKNHECLAGTKNAIDTCHLESIEDSVRITKARKDDWIPLTCWYVTSS